MSRRLTDQQSVLLDFIRGAAAIFVLLGHVSGMVVGDHAFGKAYAWQSLAVAVFFWLSGFLIAYQCLVKDRYGFGEYLVDRFCRIYVLLVPALALSFIALAPVVASLPPAGELVANLLMLHHTPFDRIWDALPRFRTYMDNAVLWTIAIEWWLYVLFGIVFFAGRSRPAARLAMVALAVPASLVVGYFALKEYIAIIWLAGAACAYAFVRTTSVDRTFVAVGATVCAAAFAVRFQVLKAALPVNMYDLQLTLALSATFFCVLLLVGEMRPGTIARPVARASAAIAFLSYSLYLTHETVRTFFRLKWGWAELSVAQGLAVTVVSLAVASAFALALENKHLALRRAIKRRLGLAA